MAKTYRLPSGDKIVRMFEPPAGFVTDTTMIVVAPTVLGTKVMLGLSDRDIHALAELAGFLPTSTVLDEIEDPYSG